MTPAQIQFIRERVEVGTPADEIARLLFPMGGNALHDHIVQIALAYERAKIDAHVSALRLREERRRAAAERAQHPYIVGVLVRQGCVTRNWPGKAK